MLAFLCQLIKCVKGMLMLITQAAQFTLECVRPGKGLLADSL